MPSRKYASSPLLPAGFSSVPYWSERPAPASNERLFIVCLEYSYDSMASENPSGSVVGSPVSGSM
ncbi:MAG: hypothetical protein QM820_55735 [Minicystis sp.]